MARKVIYIVCAVVVVLVIIAAVLPFFIDANKYKPQIETAADQALGRQISIGNIRLSIFSGGVSASDIAISDDPQYGSGPFLTAKSVSMGVELAPLIFSRQLHVTDVSIDEPQVTLLRGTSGQWNFSSLGAKNSQASSTGDSSPAGLSVQKLEIKNGKLIVGTTGPNTKRREYDQMDLTASDLSYTTQFPFQFSAVTPGNGSIKLNGKAGPLNQTDAAATPMQANLEVRNLDLNATGFLDPSSGIAGAVDFTGTVTSNGQTADSKGTLTANKLKLVPGGAPASEPVQVDYEMNYALKPQIGTVTQGDVHIGKAVVHLTGTINNSAETPTVAMKLNGSGMPATDLQTVLPAVGVTLPSGASLKSGTMDTDLTIGGPVNQLVTTGPVKLSNATLAGFNLGEKLGSLASFAGVPKGADTQIETFSSTMRVAPEGIRADSINLVVTSIGSITGSGTISSNQHMDFQLVAHLSATNGTLGQVANVASLLGGGKNGGGIPFKIQGTTSQPQFIPNIGGAASGVAKGLTGQVPGGSQSVQSLGKSLGGLLGKH